MCTINVQNAQHLKSEIFSLTICSDFAQHISCENMLFMHNISYTIDYMAGITMQRLVFQLKNIT